MIEERTLKVDPHRFFWEDGWVPAATIPVMQMTTRSFTGRFDPYSIHFAFPKPRDTSKEKWKPMVPSLRMFSILVQIKEYVDWLQCIGRHLKEIHTPNTKERADAIIQTIEVLMANNLSKVLNRSQRLPPLIVPKILDVDDILANMAADDLYAFFSKEARAEDIGPDDVQIASQWFPGMAEMEAAERATVVRSLVQRAELLEAPPLHAAIHMRLYDYAELLARTDIVQVNDTDSFGNSALILAVLHGLPHVVYALAVERKADLTHRNTKGHTALHVAIANNQLECFDILINHPDIGGAINIPNRANSTSLSIAVKLNAYHLVEKLLGQGAIASAADFRGVSPFFFALNHRMSDLLRLMLNSSTKHLWSVAHLSRPSRTAPHATPLIVAAALGEEDAVRFLCSRSVNMCLAAAKGINALHAAILCRHERVCDYLVDQLKSHGLKFLNAPCLKGYTALHLAVATGLQSVAEKLVVAGADVNAQRRVAIHCRQVGVGAAVLNDHLN